MIEVVSAVIVRDARILLTQRKVLQDFAWTWECCGGKIEMGESHSAGLLRELREEIGVNQATVAPMHIFRHQVTRPDGTLVLVFFYPVTLTGILNPVPREGQGIGWFTEPQMRSMDLTPGNFAARDAISKYMREGG
jgi:mutator protein MutT